MYVFYRPPKISKPPIARPFFDQNSVVMDFYKGHLSAMIERVTQVDFSFVMYYAPWDAESQVLRQEFENVAHFYSPQVLKDNYRGSYEPFDYLHKHLYIVFTFLDILCSH